MATFAAGIVYGLQPDALFVIVPALALPTKLAAAAYIIMFVVGTVAAMSGYTAVIGTYGSAVSAHCAHAVAAVVKNVRVVACTGATSKAIQKKNAWLTRNLSALASVVAVSVGLVVLLSGWGVQWISR